jgi:hypothetical protein
MLEGFHVLPDFDLEVASLPSPYALPGGRILLAVSATKQKIRTAQRAALRCAVLTTAYAK